MYIFHKFIYNEYIGPYSLSHVVLRFLPVNPPSHLFEVGLMNTLGDHEALSIVHHVGLHVDFSSMKSSLDL